MNIAIISSELNGRIRVLQDQIKEIENTYIPEHEQRPERDQDWKLIRRNWNYMIQERCDKIQTITEQLQEALKIPID